ncbi:MAG: outer membrane protein transport protein [Gammaproteobacteria bacterium]|nr:outer membrane protein transport protein [Gammaproteobacteria bacterium]
MRKNKNWAIPAVLLGGSLFLSINNGHAAGFALIEQSASGMGKAFAGMAASTEDASAMFYNPAAIGHLKGSQSTVAGHYIKPSSKFTNNGSVLADGSTPLTGGNGGDAGVPAFVPNAYYKSDLNHEVVFGVGLNVPFGLATSYDPGWVGRYHAQLSDLTTIAVSPTIALKSSERFAFGGSLVFQYAEATLSNRVDYGSICCGPAPQTLDGSVSLTGDDVGFGIALGGLVNTGTTRFGASYRSGISHELEGEAKFITPQAAATVLNTEVSRTEKATAELHLPETFSFSYERDVSSSLAVMADVTLTKWSSFKELAVDFENPNQADTHQPEEWEDSWRYALGMVYRVGGRMKLRAGVAYDETPIPSAELRTARIAGSDRTWASLGLGYRFNNTMSVDVGYSHLMLEKAKINNKDELTSSTLKGEYSATVDIVSAQLNMSY